MTYEQEFQNYYTLLADELIDDEHHSPEWPVHRSPTASTLVREKALSYGGLPAISSFIRAFEELKTSGAIKPLRAPKPVEKEFTLSKEEYDRLPANEIIRRYRNQNEPEFKAAVDLLIQKGLI
jgi:hypothetical protein